MSKYVFLIKKKLIQCSPGYKYNTRIFFNKKKTKYIFAI